MTDRAERQLSVGNALVPGVWPYEVANGLMVAVRRNRTTYDEAMLHVRSLGLLQIEIVSSADTALIPTICELARMQGLSPYDAAYLALAIDRKIPLATLDQKLAKAALNCGAELFL